MKAAKSQQYKEAIQSLFAGKKPPASGKQPPMKRKRKKKKSPVQLGA